jgi:sulfatase maturation enzyme AslB (radical SAM superfamily)
LHKIIYKKQEYPLLMGVEVLLLDRDEMYLQVLEMVAEQVGFSNEEVITFTSIEETRKFVKRHHSRRKIKALPNLYLIGLETITERNPDQMDKLYEIHHYLYQLGRARYFYFLDSIPSNERSREEITGRPVIPRIHSLLVLEIMQDYYDRYRG